MDLPIISMPRAEARRAFMEYRASVRELLNREADTYDQQKRDALAKQRQADDALMRGYRSLSLGRQIIDLERAIHEAGEDDRGRPRLAVCRADFEQVRMWRWRDGSVHFGAGPDSHNAGPGSRRQRNFRFRADTLPAMMRDAFSSTAIVPLIPPHLRPRGLDQYHVLWEATWRTVPPKDPALLRALGGGLYAVVAVWDLTEIEQTVLGLLRRH